MKSRFAAIVVAITLLLGGCSSTPSGTETQQVTVTPTTSLPVPQVMVTHAPDVQTALDTYLNAWAENNYSQMYALLDSSSQAQTSQDAFTQAYEQAAINLTLSNVEAQPGTSTTLPDSATVPLSVIFHTNLFGDLSRDMQITLNNQAGEWRIHWDSGLIFPELAGGNKFVLTLTPQTRGEILAEDGTVLVQQADAYALGVNADEISNNQRKNVINILSRLTGIFPKWVQGLIEDIDSTYVVVGESLADDVNTYADTLEKYDDVIYWSAYSGRYYTEGGVAPHVTGYAQSVPAEQLEEYERKGYLANELVGQSGLEAWGNDYLRGTPAATLTVTDPQGQTVAVIGQESGEAPQNITTTLNYDLQQAAQNSLENFTGAIVVLERDTGRVLAMASSPDFDPNLFQAGNYNAQKGGLDTVLDTTTTPLVNRADGGSGYPLGSVFKIITMATALESGLYTADSPTMECQYTWTELPGEVLYDWTYDDEVPASSTYFDNGLLTLPDAFMRSCNPWFYHIGLDLYRQKGMYELSNMARGFGLGSLTGIGQIEEISGNVPDPTSELDAVRLAIGQSTLLVTPLQVARFVAAVGNGGTLYRPQVVESIGVSGSTPTYTFQPEAQSTLPVSQDNLKIIQDAMLSVTRSNLGTARNTFTTISIPVYGKTGTAETDLGIPHAWFAGYTDAQDEEKPDIAIAVLAVYAGEGSEIAAPIFRRMVEVYFYDQPMRLFQWESEYYVTKTPTPTPEVTPTP